MIKAGGTPYLVVYRFNGDEFSLSQIEVILQRFEGSKEGELIILLESHHVSRDLAIPRDEGYQISHHD